MTNQIALPWEDGYMAFDVAKLQDAMLILMDLPDTGMESLRICAEKLVSELKWTDKNDVILYPVAARIALERKILLD